MDFEKQAKKPLRADELMFHPHGRRHFLKDIRSGDSTLSTQFPAGNAGKRGKGPERRGRAWVERPVLIALK
jgi:hypothetical protein